MTRPKKETLPLCVRIPAIWFAELDAIGEAFFKSRGVRPSRPEVARLVMAEGFRALEKGSYRVQLTATKRAG